MDILNHQKDEYVGLEQIKFETTTLEAKNGKTEVFLLWAHHEKTRFLGKDSNAEKK